MSSKIRAALFTGVAAVSGAASVVAIHALVMSYEERLHDARRPEETIMVLVAARDLFQGVPIGQEDLYAIRVPPKMLPEGAFLAPEHVVGRIPAERILANEVVRGERLSDPEKGTGLNAMIPRGLRAISISIKDGAALSGFLDPGNYVDVLVTIAPEGDSRHPVTSTVLQMVYVLGVNSLRSGDDRSDVEARGRQKPSVTLLVSPDEAEEIAHAETFGDITLSLRNMTDTETPIDRMVRPPIPPPIVVIRPPIEPLLPCAPLDEVRGPEKVTRCIDPVSGVVR